VAVLAAGAGGLPRGGVGVSQSHCWGGHACVRRERATRAFLQVLFRQRWVGAQISTNPREPGAVPSPGTNDVLDRREFASDGFRSVLQRTAPISCEQ
jgi:hypothetical protein